MMDERAAAHLLGGEYVNGAISCPGLGHGPKDRSLRVWLLATTRGDIQIRVHSFAGDPWQSTKEDVARRLGLPSDYWHQAREADPAEVARWREARRKAVERERREATRKQRLALQIWRTGRDPRGTTAEVYLRSRCLDIPDDIAGRALRFVERCPFGDDGATAQCMIALMRDVLTREPKAIHRTALTPDAKKIDRKMLAPAAGAAIMLDAEESITTGLTVGEGLETCLAARKLGIRPAWALGATANIAALPVIPGIEALTFLVERDENGASDRACTKAATRWHEAGRAVDFVLPRVGKDMNDVLREGAAA